MLITVLVQLAGYYVGNKPESGGEIYFAGVHYFQDETKLISDQCPLDNIQTKPVGSAPVRAHFFGLCGIVDTVDKHLAGVNFRLPDGNN